MSLERGERTKRAPLSNASRPSDFVIRSPSRLTGHGTDLHRLVCVLGSPSPFAVSLPWFRTPLPRRSHSSPSFSLFPSFSIFPVVFNLPRRSRSSPSFYPIPADIVLTHIALFAYSTAIAGKILIDGENRRRP